MNENKYPNIDILFLSEQDMIKLRGIAAILEYMASADNLDVVGTKDAIAMLAEELYVIIDQNIWCGV